MSHGHNNRPMNNIMATHNLHRVYTVCTVTVLQCIHCTCTIVVFNTLQMIFQTFKVSQVKVG